MPRPTAYAIKAPLEDHTTPVLSFADAKTMYGGKQIRAGDAIYVFDSENEGGKGLCVRGTVVSVNPTPKLPDRERQTPRVSLTIQCTAHAKRSYGRAEVKRLTNWKDGQPGTEINFKLYRQATNKIVGLSTDTAAFLETLF